MTTIPFSLPQQAESKNLKFRPRRWVSVHSLLAFSRCPRRAMYMSGYGLDSPDYRPFFDFGSAIHAGAGQVVEDQHAHRAIETFASQWSGTCDENNYDDSTDKKHNKQMGFLLLETLHRQYQDQSLIKVLPPPETQIDLGSERVSDWEIPFAIDIGLRNEAGDSIPLVGRIDAWGEDFENLKAPLDFKTCSELSDRLVNSFDHSIQMRTYCLALEALTGQPIRRAVVCFLRKTKNVQVAFHCFDYQPFQIEDTMKWLQWTGQQYLACEKTQEFPKNLAGCGPYEAFGSPGYKCEFNSLCHLTPDWRETVPLFHIKPEREFKLL